MIQCEKVDVVVIGAGPAGCCAALRLIALGYSVLIVERRNFPRPQIGESLSPGMWNILEYIGAESLLENPIFLRDLPARVIWQHPKPELLEAKQRGGAVMVDRAEFDKDLLNIAKTQGAKLLQPAQIKQIKGQAYDWQLQVISASQQIQINTQLIFDATGRAGQNAQQRFLTAPLTLALWTHVDGALMPAETSIEATNCGWLWGTPLPTGGYRVMAFLDAAIFKQHKANGLEKFFRTILNNTQIFKPSANANFLTALHTCTATPYIDRMPWQNGYIKIGEAAFALDALSSSGVEKAMRFTLQAVIAANTLLSNFNSAVLAKDFYESRLLESVATHMVWTRGYYKLGWPAAANEDFWWSRTQPTQANLAQPTSLIVRLHQAYTIYQQRENNRQQASITEPDLLKEDIAKPNLTLLLESPFIISPYISFTKIPCVVDEQVQLRPAITHPKLTRPVAFLAGFELATLLQLAPMARNLGQLVAFWSTKMSFETATKIVIWLQQQELIETI